MSWNEDDEDRKTAKKANYKGFDISEDPTGKGAENLNVLGRIDQYELLKELGTGGFGSVYLARDTVSRTFVAVKGLPALVKNNAEEMERIQENFALVSRLHHPNIAAALVLHPANKVSYSDPTAAEKLNVKSGNTLMVMEYAPGVTLTKWRRQFPERKVPLDKAIEIVRQVAAAMDYAHQRKIIHRDIKPSNVMVETYEDGTFTARVLDFGLAAEVRSSMNRVSKEVSSKSGTRQYMAPEQWAGKKQGAATDQYSLAVLFYELVTGDIPFASAFECDDPIVMMTAVTTQDVEIPDGLPKNVRVALECGLSKERDRRFNACADFVAALEGKKAPKNPKGKRWSAPVIVGFVAAVIVGVGAWYWFLGPANEAEADHRQEILESRVPGRDLTGTEHKVLDTAAELAAFELASKAESAHNLIEKEHQEVRSFFEAEIRAFENDRRAGDSAKAMSKNVTATNFYFNALKKATALKELTEKYARFQRAFAKVTVAKGQADEIDAKGLVGDQYALAQKLVDGLDAKVAERRFDVAIADAESLTSQYLSVYEKAKKMREERLQGQKMTQISDLERQAKLCLQKSEWNGLRKIIADLMRLDSTNEVAQKCKKALDGIEIKSDLEFKTRILECCRRGENGKDRYWFKQASKRFSGFDFERFENYDGTWSIVGDTIRVGGSVPEVKYLIEKKMSSASALEGYNRQSILFPAVENDDLSLVKYLISVGADVNAKETYAGRIPLDAVKSVSVAEALIAAGSDLEVQMKFKRDKEPYRVADKKSYAVMRFLCDKGAKLTDPKLIYKRAAEFGDLEFLKQHIDEVRDIPTLILYAIHSGRMDALKWLESIGQDFSGKVEDGRTALHFCASTNVTLEAYQYAFTKCGQRDVNVRDKEGRTPLHLVRNVDIAKFLLSQGALLTAKSNTGDTPLDLAYSKDMSILSCFVEAGAELNAPNSRGQNLLNHAAFDSNYEVVECLLAHKADPNIILGKNVGWQTPLLSAIANGDTKMVKTLIKGGAKVDLVIEDCHMKTALNLACFNRNLDIVICLVDAGADVNLTTFKGNDKLSPLCEAISGANKEGADFKVVQYLIDKGAKLDEEMGKYTVNTALKKYLQKIRNSPNNRSDGYGKNQYPESINSLGNPDRKFTDVQRFLEAKFLGLKEIEVSPDDDFKKIAEGISEPCVIKLKAGTYTIRNVYFKCDVALIGDDGKQTLINCNTIGIGESKFKGDHNKRMLIKNITLHGNGSQGDLLCFEKGALGVVNCKLRGCSVRVHDGASLLMVSSEMSEMKEWGISVNDGGHLIMSCCRLQNGKSDNIVIFESAIALLDQVQVLNSLGLACGIRCYGKDTALYMNKCRIAQCNDGVCLNEAKVAMNNCIIENCRSDGIELSGDVKYYSCQLIGNKYNNPRISSNGKFIQAFSPLTERDVGIR